MNPNDNQLHELLEQVHDRESFFMFVRALIADRRHAVEHEQRSKSVYAPNVDSWECTTIEDYLEAALA
jgi:hypothetical protein